MADPVSLEQRQRIFAAIDAALKEIDAAGLPRACVHSSGSEDCFGCGAGTVERVIRFRLEELFS